jgi:pyruvate formate lyase activating enzyme
MEKFYKKVKDKIQCLACNRFCLIEEGKVGYCKVRQNENGKLKLLTYGKPLFIALDPMKKNPLYHFFSGSKTLRFCNFGCNFLGLHCQIILYLKNF